ncbi:MAG: ABC transporter ATP-binding protein, partial [Chloroflexi bacterium]|nr:ABC transporter ATP-binding protein [Chloroflexota bacterium]
MQSQAVRGNWGERGGNRPGARGNWSGGEKANPKMLVRAIRYTGKYQRLALLAYGSLLVATMAQLAVPQLVQNIIDAILKGFAAAQILALPANIQTLAAQRLNRTLAQLQADQSGATGALLFAMVAIVGFASLRALFSFSQLYNAERISQNVAFDFRNQLFAKIQRLSFSYHDRNQTGQLMI